MLDNNVRLAYYFEQNKFDCGKMPLEKDLDVSPFVVSFHNDGMEVALIGDTVFDAIMDISSNAYDVVSVTCKMEDI